MSADDDFLAEIMAERTRANPAFPGMVETSLCRRHLLRALAAERVARGLSQQLVAARMGTSQPALARLERGEVDPKLSTIERFAAAIGSKLEWRIVDDGAAGSR